MSISIEFANQFEQDQEQNYLASIWNAAKVEECMLMSIPQFTHVMGTLPSSLMEDCLWSAARGENWDLFFFIADKFSIPPTIVIEYCIRKRNVEYCKKFLELPSCYSLELAGLCFIQHTDEFDKIGIRIIDTIHKKHKLTLENREFIYYITQAYKVTSSVFNYFSQLK